MINRIKLYCIIAFAVVLNVFLFGGAPAHAQTSVSNTATVTLPPALRDPTPGNNTATSTVGVTPLPRVTFGKSAVPAGPVAVGDLITYTLRVNVTQAATLNALTLTDTLGAGLGNVQVTSAGQFVCSSTSPLTCTLPAGRAIGTYTLTYTARVLPTATGTVTNTVVGTGGDNPTCVTPGGCQTTTNVTPPAVRYSKSASPTGAAVVGDLITYTLSAEVLNSRTTQVFTLTDTLGAGLDFVSVTNAGSFSCNAANPLTCTLPVNTVPGTYSVVYTARVNANATGTVRNAVVGTGSNPSCSSTCTTETPIQASRVTYNKRVSGNSATASVGDTLTFTLRAVVENSKTTGLFTLTDTLGTGLTFTQVTNAGSFTCNAANPLVCTLPAGTAPGEYTISYQATVNQAATGTVRNAVVGTGTDNPVCVGACATETTVARPSITYSKAVNAPAGTRSVGDILTYTLTTVVANSRTTADMTLTDTLGTGLDFVALGGTTAFTCSGTNPLSCVMPAGTAPGTYTVSYTARVNEQASVSVRNAVLGTGADNPTCAGSCDTNTLIENPGVGYFKTSSATAPVAVGDEITYTLTVNVSNSRTINAMELRDTLGAGLDFGSVTSAGAFACNAANPLVCTLPAGTVPGTYSLSYTATVNAAALGTVTNAVVATGGDNPVCSANCTTTTPVRDVSVVYRKAAVNRPASLKVGDTIQFELRVGVQFSQTTDAITLVDTMGVGYELVQVDNAGSFTCSNSNPLTCILPANTAPGTYDVVYTARVTAAAMGSVTNTVTGSGGDDPTCTGICTVDIPLTDPSVVYSKTSPTVGPVKVGDTITYTLQAVVQNSQLNQELTLTDTLGTGLTFGSVTSAGAFVCNAANPLICTLPVGTAPGTYAVTYTATVNGQATGTVKNGVTATGPNPRCVANCEVITPITDPKVVYSKSANTAGPVKVGDTIAYTLTAVVQNSQTSEVFTLSDTLGTGLTFGSVTSAGAFNCNASNPLSCTLPAGTVPGTYSLTYTATVNAQAVANVKNAVVGTGSNPECTTNCEVITPITDPKVVYSKAANTAGPVKVGDVITYTVTAQVQNAQTVEAFNLVDTLGIGLTFGSVTNSGAFNCSGALTCILPVGTVPGTYTLTYTATVNDQAVGSVKNAIVGTGSNPECTTNCEVITPITDPKVVYSKAANTAGPVKVGDTITYTLTAMVQNAQTVEAFNLTDTMGTGLTFGSVTNAGAFSCSGALNCNLPAGTVPGTYTLTYTATVNDQAVATVKNAVVGTGSNPECTTNCEVITPVTDPKVVYSKATNTAGPVKVGDTITYTLTAVVQNAQTVEVFNLTDTMGTGLTFGSVTNAGAFSCSGALSCNLPAGTVPGTYTMTYTATVNDQAVATVKNAVVGTGSNPECTTNCEVITPITDPKVVYSKAANTAGPVKVGDTITYTLTAVVQNAQTVEVFNLTDTMGTGLTFGSVTNAGAFSCSGALSCNLPIGTVPGTYTMTYTATVNDQAVATVKNAVVGTGSNPECTTNCEVITPITDPKVVYSKAANTAGPVKVGDVITYTLTANVQNAQTTEIFYLADTLGTGLTFGSVTSAGAFTCPQTNPLICTLPIGTVPGTYTMTYTATVNDQAVATVKNAVVGTGSNPECTTNCEVITPVTDPKVVYSKAANTAGPVKVGDTITYTLTAVVQNAQTVEVFNLTDTMGTGLTFGSVTNAGAFSCSGALSCNLPAGTVPGTYTLTYTATVNDQAVATVKNAVLGTGSNPECTTNCEVITPVTDPQVRYSKTADVTAPVKVGDTITYTLTAEVLNAQTVEVFTLTDTFGTGLDFGSVTNAGAFTCSGALSCTLPIGTVPGTYTLTYTATVNDQAVATVKNAVVGNGSNPICTTDCEVITPVTDPQVRYAKTANTAGPVKVGDVITYTITAEVLNAQTVEVFNLTDTMGTGLTFGSVTNSGAFNCSGALSCTLPTGTVPGTYTLTYTATVNDQAVATVKNAVVGNGSNPICTTDCEVITPVTDPQVRYAKTANTAGPVKVGDVITYTITAEVLNAQTVEVFNLTDTMGTGLTFGSVTSSGAFNCSGALTCTLPTGTVPGTYSLTYTATVNDQAVATVKNAVVGNGSNPICTTDCEVITPVTDPQVRYAKTADTAGPVKVGDVITYTITAEVLNAQTVEVFTLTDTFGTGLDFGSVTNASAFTCNAANPLVCTLPTGTVPGTYSLTYTATVNDQAVATVKNAVVGNGSNPICTTNCEVITDVQDPKIGLSKTVDLAADAVARVGDTLTYTVVANVTGSATHSVFTLTDTLGMGLDFGTVVNAGAFTCNAANPLVCTLPAGTAPGQYPVVYTAVVNATASSTVKNAVVGSGDDEVVCEGQCEVITTIVDPVVKLNKTSNPAPGTKVEVGQTIDYTISAAVTDAALTHELRLIDTPSQGLTITTTPNGCVMNGRELSCVLPAGTAVGTYSFTYQAVVGSDVDGRVTNLIRGETSARNQPECITCSVEHQVEDPMVRLTKVAGVKTVKVGDLVRYTLTIENLSGPNLVNATVIDTPAAGFTYVEGSLQVEDGDNFGSVTGSSPIRIGGIDIVSGERATVSYLMRVGAGVRQGTHTNSAIVTDKDGDELSNRATAEVELAGDPVFDDSMLFGTVYDDRDGDGWQDAASMSGIKVQGGFAPEAYVAGSTTMDRGAGPAPVADASSPMLHGIQIGDLAGRQSEATAPATVVIRQRLNAPTFTNDFVLTSRQGVTVRMDAAGNTTVEKSGVAERGQNGADPQVERRVTQDGDGYVVDYIVRNMGIDERGIPGVRIGTVEGLLIETDQFGRFHLEGIPGGDTNRGRNFIMKVDPASLPQGAEFTTENPVVRRITPGVPVRFDWGVRFPSAVIPGGRQLIELELGQVVFAPGEASVSPAHQGLLDQIAERVREYRGGEIVITTNGESESLALARAQAVKSAVETKLAPSERTNLSVAVRTQVQAPNLVALSVDKLRLGTILFDTDSADLRPEHTGLLDTIAEQLGRNLHREVTIVGGADVRGASSYNAELGLRRAQAVSKALSERLPAKNVRVTVEDVGLPASSGPSVGR